MSLPKQDSGRLVPAGVRQVSLLVFVRGAIGRSLCLLGVCRVDLLHVDVGALVEISAGALVDLRRRVGLALRRSGARNLRWSLVLL